MERLNPAPDGVRRVRAMGGYIWLYMAIYMAIYGCTWLHMVIYVAIYGLYMAYTAVYGENPIFRLFFPKKR